MPERPLRFERHVCERGVRRSGGRADGICGVSDAGPIPDSGPSDAGCGLTGPTLVSTIPIAPVQPHLALTGSGLAIGFESAAEDSSRAYEALLLNAAGDGGILGKIDGLQADLGVSALGSDKERITLSASWPRGAASMA